MRHAAHTPHTPLTHSFIHWTPPNTPLQTCPHACCAHTHAFCPSAPPPCCCCCAQAGASARGGGCQGEPAHLQPLPGHPFPALTRAPGRSLPGCADAGGVWGALGLVSGEGLLELYGFVKVTFHHHLPPPTTPIRPACSHSLLTKLAATPCHTLAAGGAGVHPAREQGGGQHGGVWPARRPPSPPLRASPASSRVPTPTACGVDVVGGSTAASGGVCQLTITRTLTRTPTPAVQGAPGDPTCTLCGVACSPAAGGGGGGRD